MSLEQVSANAMFGGKQLKLKHTSSVLNCDMIFSVYLPPQADSVNVPVIYWLSGLTLYKRQVLNNLRLKPVLPLFVLTPVLAVKTFRMILKGPTTSVWVLVSMSTPQKPPGQPITICMTM